MKKQRFQKTCSIYQQLMLKICGLIGFFALLMLITGCQKTIEIEATKEEPIEVYNVSDYNSVLWLDGSSHLFQPMFPQKTEISDVTNIENFDNSRVFMTELGLAFRYGDKTAQGMTYTVYDQKGLEISHHEIQLQKDTITEDYIFRIETDSFREELYIGQVYVIEVYVQSSDLRYYLPLVYTSIEANEIGISTSYGLLRTYLKENNISLMYEPLISVQAKDGYMGTIKYSFVGAKREEEGFTNYDYVFTYQVNLEEFDVQIISYNQMPKQRNYYDEKKKGWVLGDSITTRRIVSSQNGRFEVLYTEFEMILYDLTSEQLYEVYRLDSLDSDYIYDEYMDHQLEVVQVSNNGEITFAVLGYIHDSYVYSEERGIGLYHYSIEEGLTVSGFYETGDSIEEIHRFLEEKTYYCKQDQLVYFYEDYMLYQLNMDTGEFKFIDIYLGGKFYKEQGLIVWQASESKYNGAIYVVDLKNEEINVQNLYKTGVYQRLLGVDNNRLIVGQYNVEDTYEKLNGEIIYPFTKINLYLPDGSIEFEYSAAVQGNDYFYGSIFKEENTGNWFADFIERDISVSSRFENSRIYYISTGETLHLSEGLFQSVEDDNILLGGDIFEDVLLRVVQSKAVAIEFTPNPVVHMDTRNNYKFYNTPIVSHYMVTDGYEHMFYFRTLNEALKAAEGMKNYNIKQIVVDYLQDSKTGERIRQYEFIDVFDSEELQESAYLDEVINISQRPELPRGCEVTALSILLNYYMEEAPNKMVLAEQLKSSFMDYVIKDGFVNFSDMHIEFAGSMENTELPGLGVYIEPIKELAENYVGDKVVNVSGLSFEQLLTYVSADKPVLIVIPNRYQAVPNYAIQVWKTVNGYMEVTYQEHSVVVMGYDENYVYYSDPSKGILDKKYREDFKKAWESMGKQALIIKNE